ncbi:hypothetical protein LTR86_005062 [Recurvomyces mirabilis]|nr:hypothetical protein LTR86_005062 [Recurvomyces mirabilis]
MPPQRAVTANTAAAVTATARLVMARTAGTMEACITTTGQNNEDGECEDGPDGTVRLPSTRPIDQRWDRSRGIVFGNPPRGLDSTLATPNSIAFGVRSTQTRQYAQRALPASRPYQQPNASSKPTTLSDNPYHTPTPLRLASDSQKMIDLGKEKDHWKAKEAQAALRHKKTLEALEDLRKRAQAREDDLEADLRTVRASKEHQQRDLSRALDEQRRKVLEGSETTTSRLREQVASLTQLLDHFKNKAAELEQDMNTQDGEHKRDLAAQQKRLEMSLSLELAEQRRQGQIRKNERATYENYRKVYNELAEVIRDFYNPILSMERALFAVINRQGLLPTHSDGMNRINPIVLVSRGRLFRRLDEFQQALIVKHEEEGQSLQFLRNAMQDKFSNFSNAAHESRSQSRYHRIDQTQTKMETADILHYVANDLPVRQESRAVEGEMRNLQESMDREEDETVLASLRAQYADLSTTRTSLSSLIGLFARLRDIAALEALLSDNIVEKEVFVASLEAQSHIEQAGRLWNQAVAKSAFVNAESDVSFEDQTSTRKEYTRTLRQTHQRLDEYKEDVRKRAWLEQYLDLTKPGLEAEADAIIKERIESVRVEERGLLKKFGVQRISRGSSFARAVSPARPTRRMRRMEARASSEPPKASTAINSTESTTAHKGASTFGPSLGSMERNLSELKRRLLRLPEGTEKVRVAAETESLRRKVGSINLSNLQRNRELARKQDNENLPARSTGAKSVLADATSRGLTIPANAVVRRSPTRASIVRKSASTSPNGTRSAFRRTFSSVGRSSSNPGLMSENVSDDMAGFDGLEAAMQRTPISESFNDTIPTSSQPSRSSNPGFEAGEDGSTQIGSAAVMSAPGSSSTPDDNDGSVDDVESISQPRFRIPDSAYREAALASSSSNAAYWSYRLYRDDKGRSPSVHYCTNAQQAERELQHFIGQPLIGFDMEWDSTANKNSHAKRNASLIQIACEDRICLIHIARFPSDDPEQLVPTTLRSILESTGTIKAGVNIQGDARRMREYLGTEVRAQIELSHLYKVVTFDRADINKTLKGASMAVQVQKILRLPLKKDDVRVSAWARPLNQEQCDYSASDAYAGYQLFRELEVRREMIDPRPPRPAWQELKEPLVLGDGTKLRAKPKSSAVSAAKASTSPPAEELDDDAEEEFYDAVETQDAIDALVVPLQGISISYPSLPLDSDEATASAEEPELDTTTIAQAIQKGAPPDHLPATTSDRTSYSELDQADSWIAQYRTSWRIQPGKPQASVPNLRAHHLWHEQRLEIAQAAALLRDPPLSINTVASYVLEAIRHEDLPFEAVRLREVLGVMPEVVKVGRYRGIVERLQQVE